jgi:hypothetical protein
MRQLHRAAGEHNHAKDQKEQFQDHSPGLHQVATDIPPTRLLSLKFGEPYAIIQPVFGSRIDFTQCQVSVVRQTGRE